MRIIGFIQSASAFVDSFLEALEKKRNEMNHPFPGHLVPYPFGHLKYREGLLAICGRLDNPRMESFHPPVTARLADRHGFGEYEYFRGEVITQWETRFGEPYFVSDIIESPGPRSALASSQMWQMTTVCVLLERRRHFVTDVVMGSDVLNEHFQQNVIGDPEGCQVVPVDLVPIEIVIISDLPFVAALPLSDSVDGIRCDVDDDTEAIPGLLVRYKLSLVTASENRHIMKSTTPLVTTTGLGEIRVMFHSAYTNMGCKIVRGRRSN